jgi:hypothetical protein
MNTKAYCREKITGRLMQFDVTDVADYQEAIDVVKQETRARVVLCVVQNPKKEQPQ